ncbi:MAG: hypothetical protein IRZ00_20925 [Gemmatimonadetes bacterium]|nr:hypothetical protein [Gemmatimonadota bacterium]
MEERCELCARPLAAAHRHVLDVEARRILCACRACALLFERPGAGGARYRRIPERVRLLEDFRLDDAAWAALAIPVELAFFFASGVAGRVVAFYPGPAGTTESLLELDAWREIEAANPVLRELEPDVEALLVHRARGAREHWRVPIDVCYALTGVIRTSWRGLGGGEEVWARIDAFFRELRRRAGLAAPEPREEEA